MVTTGSITIPMMKRLGYSGALAGAVEVSASTGGSLLPPVMGAAAFVMVEYTGLPYRDIATAAIVPALLYYLSVYSQVHLRSLKLGLRGLSRDEIPPWNTTMREGGRFLIRWPFWYWHCCWATHRPSWRSGGRWRCSPSRCFG